MQGAFPSAPPWNLVGHAPILLRLLDRAARVAPTTLPALILGESGTGKELLARALHDRGPRPAGPYLTVNCGALPRELVESELFGHERGAFTGAQGARAGWFETASGGTLVLDEIGELPLDLQPKLLRVLETGRYFRVGGRSEVSSTARVVAMTNRDLAAQAQRGNFRLDLYHRLAGVELALPPLRDRKTDIPALVLHFLAELQGEADLLFTPDALSALADHDFPGNVRELRNLVRRTAVLHGLPLTRQALFAELGGADRGESGATAGAGRAAEAAPAVAWGDEGGGPEALRFLAGKTWSDIERLSFLFALRESGGSRRRAAAALGISRSTFCDRVRRLGLADGIPRARGARARLVAPPTPA